MSTIDEKMAYGIRKSALIEKEINELDKKQINIINFAKIATYKCSELYCYNSSNYESKNNITNCVENELNNSFGDNNWGYEINGNEIVNITFNLPEIKATSINMTSESKSVTATLSKEFLTVCD